MAGHERRTEWNSVFRGNEQPDVPCEVTGHGTTCGRVIGEFGLLCERQLRAGPARVWKLRHARSQCVPRLPLLQLGSIGDEDVEVQRALRSEEATSEIQSP